MKLSDLLSKEYILLDLDKKNKPDIIETMLNLVADHPHLIDPSKLQKDVLKREDEMSTGIGKNIALPHAKTMAVKKPLLAFAILKNGVDFNAIDNEPVRLVFLLATPEQMLAQHLKLLSRISRVASRDEIRRQLFSVKSVEDILEIFTKEEKAFPEI